MSVLLASILGLIAQDPPVVSVCDIQKGEFEPYTEVVVEGRYISDFHHWYLLTSDDCSMTVSIPHDLTGTQAEAFDAEVRNKVPRPRLLDETYVTLLLRGRVFMYSQQFMDGVYPGLAVSEVLEVTVQEASGE